MPMSTTGTVNGLTVRTANNEPSVPDDYRDKIHKQGKMRHNSIGAGLGFYLVDTLVGR
ncbi:MAG: hypothetical protein J07HX5_00527 [halophilic archaeon J07HX5]|nr:MAG: hypothetical protein J07HX5_00527 [halophilic archaeon J07HX5]